MLGLILGAIRRRSAQALLLFCLGAIAATVASAAPGYIAASTQALAASAAGYGTPGERVIAVSASVPFDVAPTAEIEKFQQQVRQVMVLPGFRTVTDARLSGRVGNVSTVLAYREGACEETVVDGRCAQAAGEVVMDSGLAATSGVKPGATITFEGSAVAQPVTLRVVGLFRPRSPYDVYWGRSTSTAEVPTVGSRLADAMLLTPLATFTGIGAKTGDASIDLIATPEAFRDTDPQQLLLASWQGTDILVRQWSYKVESGLEALADRVWTDQQLVYFGVPVGAIELMFLCWFALFLAVRQTSDERRIDVAKLKLRGSRRRDIWLLVAGQSVVPLLAGGVAGLGLGLLVAPWAAGHVAGAQVGELVRYAALGAVAVAVLGAVAAALLAERRMISEPVADLDRRISTGGSGWRSGWRSGVFDLAVLLVAAAGVYQLRAADTAGTDSGATQTHGLAVAAPLLVALVAGLLTARLVPILATAAGPGLLQAGRLGSWLVAVHLARRAGRSRVLALLTLAVAVLGSTTLSWTASSGARHDRALFEVGADRVLLVQAPTRAALLAGVRSADPSGRYAMAAVQTYGTVRMLALDSSRLAAVVPWQDAYGPLSGADLVRKLRPDAPASFDITGTTLRLTATWHPVAPVSANRVFVVVRFVTAAGELTTASFGPLTEGRGTYQAAAGQATAGHCSSERPCRVVSFALTGPDGLTSGTPPPPGSALILGELVQSGPDATVVGLGEFADRGRWRNDVRPNVPVAQLAAAADGLTLTVDTPGPGVVPGAKPGAGAVGFPAPVYVYDATTPLPVVVSQPIPPTGDIGDLRAPLFGGAAGPIQMVDQANLLPRLGRGGLLADLEYADRLLPAEPTAGSMEVWVAAGAPADLYDRLAAAGVTVVSVDSMSDRLGRLDTQGPAVALRFLLFVAGAGMLLALGSFGVWAAADRSLRGRELMALRWQGLGIRAARVAAIGGYVTFVAIAILLGASVAIAMRAIHTVPAFADDFATLPPPPPGVAPFLAVVGAAALALGIAASLAGQAVLRTARSGTQLPGTERPDTGRPDTGRPDTAHTGEDA